MKRSRNYYRSYPNWRQREMRMLLWAVVVGAIAAAIAGLTVYFANRGHSF